MWVVQEIINARSITVYCGDVRTSWTTLEYAHTVFLEYNQLLDSYFPTSTQHPNRVVSSRRSRRYSDVLTGGGPRVLLNLERVMVKTAGSLLQVLISCRRQISFDPRDKLFGILGILPHHIQSCFRADYSMSTKEVYVEIVDYLIKTTDCLDVICEAFSFPGASNIAGLPSFVPDWSVSSAIGA